MLKLFAALLVLLPATVLARAQDRPMSPPDRPPVPLTEADQQRARAAELAKKKADTQSVGPTTAVQVKVPAALATHHISTGNPAIDALVLEAAVQHGLDPCLIFSVMRTESRFNRMAVSPKGASGLMQLMPETAIRFGVKNIFDQRENVFGGAKYLRWLLDRFDGDVRLALAGYNAGEGAVGFYGNRIPPFLETQNYVRTIYAHYSSIHAGPLPPQAPAKDIAAATPAPAQERNPTYNQIIRFTSSTGDGKTVK